MPVSEFNILGDDFLSQTRENRREREIAINDFLDAHYFEPAAFPDTKIKLNLTVKDGKFIFILCDPKTEQEFIHILSAPSFKKYFKEYADICDGYRNAVSGGTPAQIETLDMARRFLHNEAAEFIRDKFKGKISIDKETARKIFTLLFSMK